MKELDLLKKDWQKDGQPFRQVSEAQINSMLHRKSSSIVKRILIISVIEFLFWSLLTVLLSDDKYQSKQHNSTLESFLVIANIVNYAVLVLFIYFFYTNYKRISATDSTHKLMTNILRTRKTVQYYIWYNLGIVALNIILILLVEFYYDQNLVTLRENANARGNGTLFLMECIGLAVVFIGIIFGIFWLFYRLLYGILLKRLYMNYNELKKTEK
ncbi:MAG: hypothetical protein CFE23_03220 [Flavobacterium sp. BFFFF1]|uniref:hypothetical protein n=1 Tax=unclassified Flavobacterium TaxID=196869 RepID=UPI000BC5E5C1|nr:MULTISPECIES: hypothetical protein [unclassified Flavobacterium]OYU81899.1 MAG: hypothetical protein CFE23_03220 [Flavobacterium sp. BFFFF1]